MKSKPYKVSGKLFRYDFDSSTVEYISKAEPEDGSREEPRAIWKESGRASWLCWDSWDRCRKN